MSEQIPATPDCFYCEAYQTVYALLREAKEVIEFNSRSLEFLIDTPQVDLRNELSIRQMRNNSEAIAKIKASEVFK